MSHDGITPGNKIAISLGSNYGDKESYVAEAIHWLQTWITDCRHSCIYATPDCHGGSRQYMNAVVSGTTTLSYDEAERLCKSHEEKCGRDIECRAKGNVPIDIDIVIWGDTILRPKDFNRQHFKIGYDELISTKYTN